MKIQKHKILKEHCSIKVLRFSIYLPVYFFLFFKLQNKPRQEFCVCSEHT